jgi:sterol desaturase/sphingolipid hydroxylase (fatty acid hydroxylase superfamily)
MLNAPQYHRRHHSRRPEDTDCNFAALLPVFDVLSGVYRPPPLGDYPETGLGPGEGPAGVLSALIWPLRRAPPPSGLRPATSPTAGGGGC